MINLFEKIEQKETPQFSMPLSLRIIKEFGQNGIDYKGIHLTDVLSIFMFRLQRRTVNRR